MKANHMKAALVLAWAGLAAGCGGHRGQTCQTNADCAGTDHCENGLCVAGNAAGSGSTTGTTSNGGSSTTSGGSTTTSGGTTTSGSTGTTGALSVTWLAPDAGFVGGVMVLHAQGSPAGDVSSIAFDVDGTAIQTVNSANAQASWDSTHVADGPHTLHAVASGAGGQSASAPLAVTVDNTPPQVSWIAPDGGLVHDSVAAQLDATDPGSGVVSVAVSTADGGPLGSASSAPYAMTLDLSSLPSGPLTLVATAKDAVGNVGTSALNVTLDRLPTITMLSPPAGGSVTGNFSVVAAASDDLGVQSVAFSFDGTGTWQAASATGDGGYSLATTTDAFASVGPHTVSGMVTDSAGQSTQVTSSFNIVDNPPVVSFNSPSEGASVSGNAAIQFTASDDVSVASTTISVNGGAPTAATSPVTLNTCLYAPGTLTVVVTATDSRGQNSSATLHLNNTSALPTMTALSGEKENDLTAAATCGTPTALKIYYASAPGVTSSDPTLPVSGGGAVQLLTPGTREYYAAAATYPEGVGPLSTEVTAEAHWACPYANWCVDDPFLGNSNVNAIAEAASNNVFAVGRDSSVLHWDGTTWTRETFPDRGVNLLGVAANGTTAVAVAFNKIYSRASNGSWSAAYSPATVVSSVTYSAGLFRAGARGVIYTSSDGINWGVGFAWDGGAPDFVSVAASDANHFAAGYDGGAVVYAIGSYLQCSPSGCVPVITTNITNEPLPGTPSLVYGSGHYWATAGGYKYIDFLDAGTTGDVEYCASPDAGFVGAHTATWTLGETQDVVAQALEDGGYGPTAAIPSDTVHVACSSTDFRVGLAGGALGVAVPGTSAFTQDSPGVGARWEAIAADGVPLGAALDGEYGHFSIDAGTWVLDSPRPYGSLPSNFYDLADDGTAGLAVGQRSWYSPYPTPGVVTAGMARLWNGSSWGTPATPPFYLRSVAELNGTYYVGGTAGKFAAFSNGTWSTLPSISVTGVGDIIRLVAVSATDIWAVYQVSGVNHLGHYTGSGWSTISSPASNPSDIWYDGAGTLWMVSQSVQSTFYQWNGSTWSTVTGGPTGYWYTVGGSGPNDVWLAGFPACSWLCFLTPGLVAHYDGTTWTTGNLSTQSPRRITSGPRGQYLVDGLGTLLHRGE